MKRQLALLLLLAGVGAPSPAASEPSDPQAPGPGEPRSEEAEVSAGPQTPAGNARRIEELEAQLGAVAAELDDLRKSTAVPEERELESFSGLGPAASKIYQRDRGLSIGGYGEVRLRADIDDSDSQSVFDALRGVFYVGYKFNDWILVNTEIELEHAGSGGGGDASIEFLTLDFLLHESANIRAGLLLIPMGFVNETHEPTFYFGAERPEVERRIIPSTWRENGVGIFGKIGDRVQYRMYGVNGFDAAGSISNSFDSGGLRGGRQKGSEALADHFAFVGRVDVDLLDTLVVGTSVYTGKSGQNRVIQRQVMGADVQFRVPDAWTTIWEVHGEYKAHGLSLRALWAQAHVDQTAQLSAALGKTVAKRMVGGYGEIAYDILPHFCADTEMSLEPFYRFEHVDTQDKVVDGLAPDRNKNNNIHVVGLQFKPHPQVVVKLDYRNFRAKSGTVPDEVQLSLGYVF